jgi:hypothetical protein
MRDRSIIDLRLGESINNTFSRNKKDIFNIGLGNRLEILL